MSCELLGLCCFTVPIQARYHHAPVLVPVLGWAKFDVFMDYFLDRYKINIFSQQKLLSWVSILFILVPWHTHTCVIKKDVRRNSG